MYFLAVVGFVVWAHHIHEEAEPVQLAHLRPGTLVVVSTHHSSSVWLMMLLLTLLFNTPGVLPSLPCYSIVVVLT